MSVNLVPLLLTGVRHHPPGRTDKHLCRCFGAPARRVFPDHLIKGGELSHKKKKKNFSFSVTHVTEKAKKCNTWSETLKKHPFGRQVENGASRCVHSKKKVSGCMGRRPAASYWVTGE